MSPRITLHNITIGPALWQIHDMDMQITACKTSKATFNLTSSKEHEESTNMSLTVANSSIGNLMIGRHIRVTISSSERIGSGRLSKTAITVVGSTIVMSNCTFLKNNVSDGPSILYAFGGSHVVVTNCTFKQNTGYYGAIFVNDSSHASIRDSVFEGNMPPQNIESTGTLTIKLDSTANIIKTKFSYNQAYSGAAVTNIHQSMVIIIDSVFKGNWGCSGGAIANAYNSKAKVQHSLFSENAATFPKSFKVSHVRETISQIGSLNIIKIQKNGKIPWITTDRKSVPIHASTKAKKTVERQISCAGGAIFSSVSEIYVNDSIFLNNTSTESGGAIHAYSSTINLERNLFNHNAANEQGGAVFVTTDCRVKVNHTSFLQNQAFQMGAISAGDNTTLVIEGSNFITNFARQFGGAIAISRVGTVIMINCLFLENYAIQSAAFGAEDDISVFVMNCTFQGNVVDEYYAALWITRKSSLRMENSEFKETRSRQCTVSVDDFSTGFITSSRFKDNTALKLGKILASFPFSV